MHRVFSGKTGEKTRLLLSMCEGDGKLGAKIRFGWSEDDSTWALSILLGKLVKLGLLKVTNDWARVQGHTWQKHFVTTELGVEMRRTDGGAHKETPGVNIESYIQKIEAKNGGWVRIPPGTDHLFKDAGYETTMVARKVDGQ